MEWACPIAGCFCRRVHTHVRPQRAAVVVFPRQEVGEPTLCKGAVQAPVMAGHSSLCLSF